MERKLKVTEPPPSQGAYLLRKFLQSQNVDIPLGMAQEAFARTRGFNDWNSLTAILDPRGRDDLSHQRGNPSADDRRPLDYQRSLSKVRLTTWMERFDYCWPESVWGPKARENAAYQRPSLAESCSEGGESESSLRADLYLALQATALGEQFRYIVGELGLGKAESGSWLQLAFGKRIGNRFELKLCPTLNWDGLEVLFVTYEFDDVLGDSTIDEIWHAPVVGNPDEQLCKVIERALVRAKEIEADVHSWMRRS